MAKQLTAPGCKYSIVARVDTTIYSPDQKWVLDVPAGQTDFIAETNEVIIPGDAMMCRKKCQIDADLARFNVLGRGAGSLATFVTRAIEQIVGKGNAKVEYGDGKLAVVLAPSVTAAQFAEVENLLQRLLPKDVTEEIDPLPSDYMQAEFLESTGTQIIDTEIIPSGLSGYRAEVQLLSSPSDTRYICGTQNASGSPGFWFMTIQSRVRMEFSRSNILDYTYRDGDASRKLSFETNFLNSRFFVTPDNKWKIGDLVYTWARSFTLFKSRFGSGYDRTAPIRIFSWKHSDGKYLTRDFIPALDPAGVPCMFDLVSRKPFYNSGTGQFIVGLTMTQALDLANLPVATTVNTLTISLPKEASLVQHNQEVETALSTAAEKGWNIAVRYRDEFEDEAIRDKYAECVTLDDLIAVNPDYRDDLTSDGEWIYPVPVLTDISSGNKAGTSFHTQPKLKKWSVPVPNLKSAGWAFKSSGLTEWTVGFPAMKGGWDKSSQIFSARNFTRFAGDLSKLEDGGQMFWYVYGMTSFESTLSSLRTGSLMFTASRLDKDSALRILNSIPPYTSGNHPLLIGIHIDHQFDEEVLTAITYAEEKGWTLTIQWNPGGPEYTTPKASTFGLRKPSIYAKLDTMENPDGTSEEYLAWGHYVTNWEENGYQEFASIEEAEEHFNIKKEVEA